MEREGGERMGVVREGEGEMGVERWGERGKEERGSVGFRPYLPAAS